jgi:hypothetical protein
MNTMKLPEWRFNTTLRPEDDLNAQLIALSEEHLLRLKAHGWTPIRDLRPRDLVSNRAQRPVLERGAVVPGDLQYGTPEERATDVFDHAYTLRHGSGLLVYVGEPYPFPLEQARPYLPALCGDRYRVIIRPDLALHNPLPGGTVAVMFYAIEDAARVEALLPKETRQ